jgi:hypothetical protein
MLVYIAKYPAMDKSPFDLAIVTLIRCRKLFTFVYSSLGGHGTDGVVQATPKSTNSGTNDLTPKMKQMAVSYLDDQWAFSSRYWSGTRRGSAPESFRGGRHLGNLASGSRFWVLDLVSIFEPQNSNHLFGLRVRSACSGRLMSGPVRPKE